MGTGRKMGQNEFWLRSTDRINQQRNLNKTIIKELRTAMYTQVLNVTNRAGNSGTLIITKKMFCILNNFITFVKKKHTMVKVYFELDNGKYAELVAIFDNEETYDVCLPALEKLAKKHNFDMVTESVDEETELKELV
jgi:hypothetical protein